METRRGSKRKHSENTAQQLDMDNPKNWTKDKLLLEIQKLGFKVPSSLKVTALIQIYNDNKKDTVSSVDNVPLPSADLISAAEGAAAQIQQTRQIGSTSVQTNTSEQTAINPLNLLQSTSSSTHMAASNNVHNPLHSTIGNTQTSLSHLHNGQLATINSVQIAGSSNHQNALQTNGSVTNDVSVILRQQGVPAERYRNVEVVSTHLRNQIIAGKDINLALLLIPNNESTSEYRRVNFDGVEYVMKPGDPRLSKNLTLGEFIMAFSRYKNIVCEVLPHRRTELDHYERDIVEMANQFGGNRFYDYHKAFSAKAAALLHQQHIKVDWSIRDNNLFCTIFAGMKANICGLCSSVNHSSEFCPLLVNPNLKKGHDTGNNRNNSPSNPQNPRKTDKNIVTFQGIPLCYNYNDRVCTRQKCKFLHLCSDCFSPHPKSQCKVKQNVKTEHSGKTGDKKTTDKTDKSNQWLCNDLEFQASTPVNIEQFKMELSNHPDSEFVEYLCSGLTHGFDPGIENPPKLTTECRNNRSA